MTTATTPTKTTGEPTTLATYTTETGELRALVGQRVDGIVRVTDQLVGAEGASYLVEPELESKAALDALIEDYLAKAAHLGYPPMHGWF